MNEVKYNIIKEKIKLLSEAFAKVSMLEFREEDLSFIEKKENPEKVLKSIFGYKKFRPLQKEIIENVLEGRDTLAILPTGGGKSLCYQIPALMMEGLTVVISPLIALMEDQVAQLDNLGIAAAYINSSLSWDDYKAACRQVQSGKLKLLYVSPEGLNTEKMLNLLHSPSVKVECITIDEAHCISEWGHDFRPDYLDIAQIKKQFPQSVCLALTATATEQVKKDIIHQLKMEEPKVLCASFNRPNIFLHVERKAKPLEQVLCFLEQHKGESGIIYCFSRKNVDQLNFELQRRGIKSLSYHAGLTDTQRSKNQKAFIQDKVDVMIATVAFGMGINKPDVRFVIHYDMPKSVEQYYQEIGRAGRDGLSAEALLLFGLGDINKIRWLFNDSADSTKAENLLRGMINYAESTTCRRKQLLAYFGENFCESQSKDEKDCCCDICASVEKLSAPATILTKASIQPRIKSFPKKNQLKESISDEDQKLADKLRAWRRKAADELEVPPYVIFGDKSLYDIASKHPRTTQELLNCYGIGESKAEKFGYYILRIIKEE